MLSHGACQTYRRKRCLPIAQPRVLEPQQLDLGVQVRIIGHLLIKLALLWRQEVGVKVLISTILDGVDVTFGSSTASVAHGVLITLGRSLWFGNITFAIW